MQLRILSMDASDMVRYAIQVYNQTHFASARFVYIPTSMVDALLAICVRDMTLTAFKDGPSQPVRLSAYMGATVKEHSGDTIIVTEHPL